MPYVTNYLNGLVVVDLHDAQIKAREPGRVDEPQGTVTPPDNSNLGLARIDIERYGEQWHIVLADNTSVWSLTITANIGALLAVEADDWVPQFPSPPAGGIKA